MSAAGGACILMSAGPIMPLVAVGTGGLVLGSMGSYGMAKLEKYLSSKKVQQYLPKILTKPFCRTIIFSVSKKCTSLYKSLDICG